MRILFHSLFRERHEAELRRMQPAVEERLRELRAQRELRNLQVVMARNKRNAAEMV